MSHLVTVKTKVHDPIAIQAACRRQNLPAPALGTAHLYSGDATGLLLLLPGWQYPAVIDTLTGSIHYDNYNEAWGERRHLDRFLQNYAVEKAKLEARRKGCSVTEQTLEDGSIKLQIREGS